MKKLIRLAVVAVVAALIGISGSGAQNAPQDQSVACGNPVVCGGGGGFLPYLPIKL